MSLPIRPEIQVQKGTAHEALIYMIGNIMLISAWLKPIQYRAA